LGITSEVVRIARKHTYIQGGIKERRGEDWSSKGMDRCLLTSPPLRRHGVTMHKDLQEVARSALVKGVE
jgi:hypothetical protein